MDLRAVYRAWRSPYGGQPRARNGNEEPPTVTKQDPRERFRRPPRRARQVPPLERREPRHAQEKHVRRDQGRPRRDGDCPKQTRALVFCTRTCKTAPRAPLLNACQPSPNTQQQRESTHRLANSGLKNTAAEHPSTASYTPVRPDLNCAFRHVSAAQRRTNHKQCLRQS